MTTALVLGAAGGVGRAVVARLAAGGGMRVVAVDQDPAVLQLADASAALVGDVTEPGLLARAFEAAGDEPPSVLVHALLYELRAPLGELSPEQWHKVFDVGLVSAWQAAAELVRRKGEGPASVVLVGSVHAHGAVPGCAPYAVAKAGLGALARAAATEWGPLGVRTNVVEPGFVPVPRNAHRVPDDAARARVAAHYPLGRICSPAEIADAVAFLAGPTSSYVNGVCLPVDGGYLAVLPEVTPTSSDAPSSPTADLSGPTADPSSPTADPSSPAADPSSPAGGLSSPAGD
ncbi:MULTISPECIES: SDR family NAD(P)-dependent oxidoreductase [unclassified Streptomyces]|uniref:SDR family NAD(P)-dependent oxidoreductase n=1 Tax=unclassified Streptomyces TaxID=2593676 RepID=UPI00278C60EA|nr:MULTISPECIES: SDR family oxidoreductase [unclassified Streptomyces]